PILPCQRECLFPWLAQAAQGQRDGRHDGQLTLGVLGAVPYGQQMLRVQLCGLYVTLWRQGRPVLIPAGAGFGAVQMSDAVGVDFYFAAFALDDGRSDAQT